MMQIECWYTDYFFIGATSFVFIFKINYVLTFDISCIFLIQIITSNETFILF